LRSRNTLQQKLVGISAYNKNSLRNQHPRNLLRGC
jgi:hypothetical protein